MKGQALARARTRMRKRRDRFVVGYMRRGNCVYGKASTTGLGLDTSNAWTDPLTLPAAIRKLDELESPAAAAIFELVPVATNGRLR